MGEPHILRLFDFLTSIFQPVCWSGKSLPSPSTVSSSSSCGRDSKTETSSALSAVSFPGLLGVTFRRFVFCVVPSTSLSCSSFSLSISLLSAATSSGISLSPTVELFTPWPSARMSWSLEASPSSSSANDFFLFTGVCSRNGTASERARDRTNHIRSSRQFVKLTLSTTTWAGALLRRAFGLPMLESSLLEFAEHRHPSQQQSVPRIPVMDRGYDRLTNLVRLLLLLHAYSLPG
jgi:hypothetical protein